MKAMRGLIAPMNLSLSAATFTFSKSRKDNAADELLSQYLAIQESKIA